MKNLEPIRKIGLNAFTLGELVTQLKSALGVLPFVGAGLAIPFGFKGWQQFLLAQGKSAGIEKTIKQRIKQGEYEEAAQDLMNVMAHRMFSDELSYEYGDHKLGEASLRGTVTYLPRLASGPVITTNFDHVLEKAFEESNARFESVIWGAKAEAAQKAVYQNRRTLLKLHGDIEDRTDRILTLDEYEKNYGVADPSQVDFTKPLPNLLKILLTGRPVLFLGCSLNQDRVVRLLKHVAETNRDLPHYAVVEAPPGARAFAAQQTYFSKHGIRPIWYPKGEHKYVEMIVQFLSQEITDRVSDERRFEVPKDVISFGMKATEALEILIRRNPEIASIFIIRYKDKPRLRERTGVRLADNPTLFIAQAAIHNNTGDQVMEVRRTELKPTFWKQLFDEAIREDFVLAVSSKVRLKNKGLAHIPMMDFKFDPTPQNVNIAKEGFIKIGQTNGVLLNSGKSFHYYGYTIMSEEEWRTFLGQSLLLSDVIDTRYVGHALINNECRLRISTTSLNPFIPTVVDTF